MSRVQIVAVALTVILNGLDGFDVLSISFASPGIAKAWGVDKAALGVVLSMDLIGMMVGSVLLGGIADKIGRRPTILACLLAMASGMFLAAHAGGLAELKAYRLLTGLGIGGMLAATNAVAAEFSNTRRRGLSLSLMAIGFPLGGVIGGTMVASLLKGGDWRLVFDFGAIAAAILVPLVWFLLPESVNYLIDRRPASALAKVNRTLGRMGRPSIAALPDPDPATPSARLADLARPPYLVATALLVSAYFAQMFPFYLLLKWLPKIVVDMGSSQSVGAGMLVWVNLGGVVGGLILGGLTTRLGLKTLTITAMLGTAGMTVIFGLGQANLGLMTLVAAATQMFGNAAVVGLYSYAARVFPTELRATGTGLMIGLGRAGAALSPILVGYLFHAGLPLSGVAATVAVGGVVAAGALAFMRPVTWAAARPAAA